MPNIGIQINSAPGALRYTEYMRRMERSVANDPGESRISGAMCKWTENQNLPF